MTAGPALAVGPARSSATSTRPEALDGQRRLRIREAAKLVAFWLAAIVVTPALVSYRIRAAFLGCDRALEGSTQALALVPGLGGQYLRRAFLSRVLASCHRSVTVEFGVIFSDARSQLDENVYIGPRCHLGYVHLERDALIGPAVHIPSGPDTHGTDDCSRPIREQPGTLRMVRIGAGSWIGSAAVVMADVGRDAVVAAGSVVVRPVPDMVVAGGVPARVLRPRGAKRGREPFSEPFSSA
jgi:virginiamycin A acetyltransferase